MSVNGVAFSSNLVPSSKYGIKCPNMMSAKKITIHNTANKASAKNEVKYCRDNNNEVSYHVAVDDIEAIQVVPFNRNAWHCGDGGNGYGNRNTIGIEICYSTGNEDQFNKACKNTIKYVAGLCVQQGIVATKDTIKKHQDWSSKYCPHKILDRGDWNKFQQEIIDEYNRITKKSGSSSASSSSSKSGSSSSSSKGGHYVYFPANQGTWRVYPLNAPSLSAKHSIGSINPPKFGGLTYPVKKDRGGWDYEIETGSYGRVRVYCAPETGAKVSWNGPGNWPNVQ
ncbi:peptidoglycan recognition protein family protein [Listeria ilorinensis]|uniref:peptidoglycan recognition protein family protein n=1 Tax=Listeria ilorinensis TaxID=2867439 RepID=UPI001EF46BF5|nr:N-acetylmuramoyl-L-alanine amidase [Listeria ilorinensis]